jgi:hypothetical protein
MRLTGQDAIKAKNILKSTVLCKFGDPVEGPKSDIETEFAEDVIREDPQLVYTDVDLEALWWAWHDQDMDRWSPTVEEAEQRCIKWVDGGSDDGPDIER